ncbi:MAG: hypothetical protein FJY80_14465 [Candidatus Aminicenantes bacterium]|nr:hypothetical protein [Candidatus Aminicenantes bacterium]
MASLIARAVAVVLGIVLAVSIPACKPSGQTALVDPAVDEEVPEEAEAEPLPKPAPPKVNEEVYVDLTVQSVLIREQNKEDALAAEKDVEALFEKAGVTIAEYKAFEQKLSFEKANELQRKIQEKLQAFIK